ncbi:MAG: MmgE/PrpD family protein [Clostridia bacterium]|nr:MmgE/PrpD family protein [Clostridia bacterium]
MNFQTDYTLEKYILEASWERFPSDVQERLRGCLIDLLGALISGTKSDQFAVGLRMVKKAFGEGNVAAIGTNDRFSAIGAATAMGHASNAYDIDDGHNIIRAHPGTSFIGALLSVAYEKDATLGELFSAMLVAYEASIRMGVAIMDHYKYAHSSGTFGAIGVAVGVGKLLGFNKEQLNHALSISEFNAPLVPGIRSVEYPSMNKDGVPFGVMIGMLSTIETECGFTGNKNLLESDEYRHLLADLGEKYEVLSLYFKPYPCCRWAHPAIDACISVMKENSITADNIDHVTIKTFRRATLLSKIEPKSADEAQYNIAYPVATALVRGDFSIDHVMPKAFSDSEVLDMMKRLSFEVDMDLDRKFPQKRICRAEIQTKDARVFVSRNFEPSGEAHENIGTEWLTEKFHRITACAMDRQAREQILSMVLGDTSLPIRTLVNTINSLF